MPVNPNLLLDALRRAAQRKGGQPLTATERAMAVKEATVAHYRARFLNVIRLAGYAPGAAESICNAWLPKYLAEDLAPFEAMLADYEANDGDPE